MQGLLEAKTQKFRRQLVKLPREDLLEIIDAQDPELTDQIQKIEYAFANKLRHLTWPDGSPIEGRPMPNEELALLIDEPFEMSEELSKMGLGVKDQRKVHIAGDPVLWAKHVLGAEPRVYQILMLRHPSLYKVLRAGRRLGKTFTMAVLLLHYAYTTKNGKCLVLTPMKGQAGLIYDEMMKLAQESEIVTQSITRNVTSPQYEIEFANRATVRFFTSGESSGGKSNVTRGQEAHLIVLDEMDYMADDSLDALIAMMQKTAVNQPDKRMIGASTPTGQRGRFWKWCNDDTGRWKEFWFPSYCNPLWDDEMEQFMHEEHSTEMSFRHEVEADWGEDVDGVYPRLYVDLAFKQQSYDPEDENLPIEKRVRGWRYRPYRTDQNSIYVLGVDWNSRSAGSAFVMLEAYSQKHQDEELRGKIRVAHREEMDRGEYTLLRSIDKVIELNAQFLPDHIYIDMGYGATQNEQLHKYGVDNPSSGLQWKVKPIDFGSSIEVRDPFTMQKMKKSAKPFMVNNLRGMLEKGQIIFPGQDEDLYMQLISYIVKTSSALDRPTYAMGSDSVPDHAHDALILAALAITENYDDLMKTNYAMGGKVISNETFLNTFSLSTDPGVRQAEMEVVEKVWGSASAAPLQIKRAMTVNKRRSSRPIRRKMF